MLQSHDLNITERFQSIATITIEAQITPSLTRRSEPPFEFDEELK